VQAHDLANGSRSLRHLERVRESRPIMVARRRKEDLGLVLQAAERLAVDDSIAVALKCRADVVCRLGPEPAARLGAFRRLGRQNLAFARLELLANRGQRGCCCHTVISARKLVPFVRRPTPKISARVWPRSAN